MVCCFPFLESSDIALDVAKEGLAVLYKGSGAEYGGNKMAFEKAIDEAKLKKKNMGHKN